MIKFEKVTFNQFLKDFRAINPYSSMSDADIKQIWGNIKLPERSSIGSAGYDFFAPYGLWFRDTPNGAFRADQLFPTGIRWVTDRDDIVLICLPRSGQGFKYGLSLLNTAGVIDSDYCNSDNEGHILCKMQSKYDFTIEAGKAFMQGIILPYITVDEDNAYGIRNGGFGSSGK